MFLQTLSFPNKKDYYYFNNQITYEIPGGQEIKTWNYVHSLQNIQNLIVAKLIVNNVKISELEIPHYLKSSFSKLKQLIQSQFKSLIKLKIDCSQINYWELIPKNLLSDYVSVCNQITNIVIEDNGIPEIYNHILNNEKLISSISQHQICCNGSYYDIKYNQFGTLTNRLKVESGSFPIFNYPKNERNKITPNNDYFLYMDFNASELRVLCGLLGMEQVDYDVHEWNNKNVFHNMGRNESKKEFFHWLFSGIKHPVLEEIYDIVRLKEKYWCDGVVRTPFSRNINVEDRLFISYLIQSTSADLCLEQDWKVHRLLIDKKSYVSMVLHDAIVVDLKKEDLYLIEQLKDVYSNTRCGNFLIDARLGKNLGDMIKI